jgi:hypothetical protein
MREIKKTSDYAEEIHDILLRDYKTDIPVSQINHILQVSSRRIIESLEKYRYVKVHPFYFYFRLHDYKRYLKNKKSVMDQLFLTKPTK